jgi:hypothetical protein
MDIKAYFKGCRKKEAEITKQLLAGELSHQPPPEEYEDEETLETKKRPTFFYVMSLDNPHMNITPGQVSKVTARAAAKGIFDQTHRLCTAEEVKEFNAEMKRRQVELADEIHRKQKALGGGTDPDLIKALTALATKAVGGDRAPKAA